MDSRTRAILTAVAAAVLLSACTEDMGSTGTGLPFGGRPRRPFLLSNSLIAINTDLGHYDDLTGQNDVVSQGGEGVFSEQIQGVTSLRLSLGQALSSSSERVVGYRRAADVPFSVAIGLWPTTTASMNLASWGSPAGANRGHCLATLGGAVGVRRLRAFLRDDTDSLSTIDDLAGSWRASPQLVFYEYDGTRGRFLLDGIVRQEQSFPPDGWQSQDRGAIQSVDTFGIGCWDTSLGLQATIQADLFGLVVVPRVFTPADRSALLTYADRIGMSVAGVPAVDQLTVHWWGQSQVRPVLGARILANGKSIYHHRFSGVWEVNPTSVNNGTRSMAGGNWIQADFVGIAMTTADSLVGDHGFSRVGILSTAQGSTSTAQWLPGSADAYLDNAIVIANHAQQRPGSQIDVLASRIGETDAQDFALANAHAANMTTIIGEYRAKVNPNVLVLIMRLADNLPLAVCPFRDTVRAQQASLHNPANGVYVIDSTGSSLQPDEIHDNEYGVVLNGRIAAAAIASIL